MKRPAGQGLTFSRSGFAPDISLHQSGEMAALLAHQIAQPLAAISNFAAAAQSLLKDSIAHEALPGNSMAKDPGPKDPGPNETATNHSLDSQADAGGRFAPPANSAPASSILQAIAWLQKISEQTQRAGDLLGLLRRMANRSQRQATPELSAIVREAIDVAERVTLGDGAVEIGRISNLELPCHHGWELESTLALLLRHCLTRDPRPQLDTLVGPVDFEIRVEIRGEIRREIREADAEQPRDDASAAFDGDAPLLSQVRDSAKTLGGRLWATEHPLAGRRAFHLLLPRREPAASQVEGTVQVSTNPAASFTSKGQTQ